ncbi:MAG: Rho termination factor N-terminal domain-containing protein [Actinobacteria bacterium]|nr:Rho termination factor N-terminal domain-containing protein [Actinomycetota bacterium]
MTVDELRSLARARDIDGRSDMNKAELIAALQQS